MGFLVSCTKAEKRTTLYEESNVDPPYTDCNCRSDLISVPNGNASNLNEQLIWGEMVVSQECYQGRTCEGQSIAKRQK